MFGSFKRFGSDILCLRGVVTLPNLVVVVVDPGRLSRFPFSRRWFWYLWWDPVRYVFHVVKNGGL